MTDTLAKAIVIGIFAAMWVAVGASATSLFYEGSEGGSDNTSITAAPY
jgi:hypothetical protein